MKEGTRCAALFNRFEPSPDTRVLPLEGVRGFAAILVFFVHFRSHFSQLSEGTVLFWPIEVLGALGHTGVDIFFILSGYLVYGIVMNERFQFQAFFRRRVNRLYPTFLAVFSLYLSLELLLPARSHLPKGAGQALLCVALNLLMLPGVLPIRPIIAVAWSLSYEWCFYIVLPVTVAVLAWRKWPWQWRVGLVVLLAAVCIALAQVQFLANSRYSLFGAGIIVWELVHNTKLAERLPSGSAVAMASLFAVNLLAIGIYSSRRGDLGRALDQSPVLYTTSLFVSGALLVLYAVGADNFVSQVFSWRPLRWVGNISYSYYLIHGITMVAIRAALLHLIPATKFSPPLVMLLLLGCFAACLLSAAVLYLSVEWPFSLAMPQWHTITGPKPGQLQIPTPFPPNTAVNK